MGIAQEMADAQRAEAKQMLYSAIGLPENTCSEAIDRAVDCIISAAILEAVMTIQENDMTEEKMKELLFSLSWYDKCAHHHQNVKEILAAEYPDADFSIVLECFGNSMTVMRVD